MSTLILAPHMDDEVLGCGGVIQRLEDVTVVFMTEREVDVRHTPAGRVAYRGEDRIIEMEAVAAALGFATVRLRYSVHELERVGLVELLSRLEDLVTRYECSLLLTPAESHDEDHRALRRAVRALTRPHLYPGTWLEYMTWGAPGPYEDAVVVPLTEQEMKLKVKCMEMYATQLQPGGADPEPLYAYLADSCPRVQPFGGPARARQVRRVLRPAADPGTAVAEPLVVCPTHGRAGQVLVLKLLPDIALVVAESQQPAYAEAHPEIELIVHPDSVRGIAPKRQWIVDTLGDVVMFDDDVTGISDVQAASGEQTAVRDPEVIKA